MTTTGSIYTVDHYTARPKRITYKAFLARSGTQDYLKHELGLKADEIHGPPSGDEESVAVYRPPEELFSPETMASFENVPVTIGHPERLLNANPANSDTEIVGQITNVYREREFLVGKIVLHSQRAINILSQGKNELSIGYTFTFEPQKGIDEQNTPYEGIQRNLRGDHVAIVQKGRCGCQCRVVPLDQEQNGEEIPTLEAALSILQDIRSHMNKTFVQNLPMGDSLTKGLLRAHQLPSSSYSPTGRDLFISRTFYTHQRTIHGI